MKTPENMARESTIDRVLSYRPSGANESLVENTLSQGSDDELGTGEVIKSAVEFQIQGKGDKPMEAEVQKVLAKKAPMAEQISTSVFEHNNPKPQPVRATDSRKELDTLYDTRMKLINNPPMIFGSGFSTAAIYE